MERVQGGILHRKNHSTPKEQFEQDSDVSSEKTATDVGGLVVAAISNPIDRPPLGAPRPMSSDVANRLGAVHAARSAMIRLRS